MKMRVVTTITSTLDINTMETDTEVDISDEDGLSEVSSQVLGAVLIGSLRSTERGLREKFHIPERVGQRCADDSDAFIMEDDNADPEYLTGHVHDSKGHHIKP